MLAAVGRVNGMGWVVQQVDVTVIAEFPRTPSGKVELAPAALIADVARAQADLSAPAPDMVLIGRRQVRSNNSWMHNLPLLAKGLNESPANINRALNTLISEGLAVKLDNGRFAPSVGLLQIAPLSAADLLGRPAAGSPGTATPR